MPKNSPRHTGRVLRACLDIVNTPNRRAFCRYTSPIFLESHPGFLQKIGLVFRNKI